MTRAPDEIGSDLESADQARACLAALEANPDDARALYLAARLMRARGRFAAAVKLLDRAVVQAPDEVALHAALGETLLDQGLPDAALAVLRRAAGEAPDDATLCCAIGRALHALARYKEALSVTEHGLLKSPHDGALLLLAGQLLTTLQRLNEARHRIEQALEVMPQNPQAHLLMAQWYFLQGRLPEAFSEYHWRRRLPGYAVRQFVQPAWSGDDVAGKTLLVYAEPRLDDTLQFARYLPALVSQGARVLLACDPALHPLLQAIDGVTLVLGNTLPSFDGHAALPDLPGLLATRIDDIPAAQGYLVAPQRRLLPPAPTGCRLRAAIVWAGNPQHDRLRDCPLTQFLQLAGRRGVELFSLQVGEAATALAACGGDALIEPLGAHLSDLGVTASVLAELDLLITVDTATAHLAGALGRPTWLLLPYAPDGRWLLEGDDTPWYRSLRLFRQPRPNDWESVFAAVGQALDQLLRQWPEPRAVAADAVAAAHAIRERASARFKRNDLPGAIALLRGALRHDPNDSSIWNNLGVFLREAKHDLAAEACYRRALDCGGHADAGLRTNLGNALNDLGRTDEAVACHELALAIEPDSPLTIKNLGVSLRCAGRHAEAVNQYDRLADDQSARWDRAQSLLSLGRFKEGWRDYDCRWSLKQAGPYPRRGERWTGQPFKRQTLLLIAEQGFGDTLLATRFLPRVKALGGRVLLECQPELMRLLGRTTQVDAIFAKGTRPPEPYDFQLPMMSLPGLFVSDTASIPAPLPLAADPAAAALFANLLSTEAKMLKVGIVWSGSVTFKGNAHRAAALVDFLRFATVPGVRLFSLQKGSPQDDLKRLGLSSMVTDLSPLLLDFECTTAALAGLDLLIMTDSATAHLAGSLACPVWLLLGSRPYWLWGGEESTPWYPGMRLLRQREPGNWDELFERAEMALREWAQKRAKERVRSTIDGPLPKSLTTQAQRPEPKNSLDVVLL